MWQPAGTGDPDRLVGQDRRGLDRYRAVGPRQPGRPGEHHRHEQGEKQRMESSRRQHSKPSIADSPRYRAVAMIDQRKTWTDPGLVRSRR